jgi:hypothetical protein
VSQSEEDYVVDVQAGNCECPDKSYRLDDETPCKHTRRARFALGVDPIPAHALEECEVEPNFGAFVNEDAVRVAMTDGGVLEAGDDAEVLGVVDEEEDETDECEECAKLTDLACFECYMQEHGHAV